VLAGTSVAEVSEVKLPEVIVEEEIAKDAVTEPAIVCVEGRLEMETTLPLTALLISVIA
jgi:hypothetical protein